VRPVLGVIVAFVAMMPVVLGLSLGLWFALGVDGVLLPGRFDGTIILSIYAVLAGVVGALFARWLCVTISRSRTAVIVLAVLCFVMGSGNIFAQWNKPEPGSREPGLTIMQAIEKRKEPLWFTLLMPVAGSGGALVSGLLILRTKLPPKSRSKSP
jgi:hypothetical protein